MTSSRAAMRAARPAGPPPGRAALHEAALAHLARFAASEAGLLRMLDRRIDRWRRAAERDAADLRLEEAGDALVRAAGEARATARRVAARLVELGLLDDAAFAEGRVRSLARAGRSRRAIAARLAIKGVPPGIARAALPEGEDAELAAALLHAKRRRIGPFRLVGAAPSEGPDDDAGVDRRQAARMARAGFPADVAMRALRMPREEAEALLRERARADP